MQQQAETSFWKWYFRGWLDPGTVLGRVVPPLALICMGSYLASVDSRARKFIILAVTNPFFDLAWLYITAATIVLDYMRHRLQMSERPPSYRTSLEEQEKIPNDYATAFGKDSFTRLWAMRWIVLLLMFIAGLQFLFRQQ